MCAWDLFCPWQQYNTAFVGHTYFPFFLRECKASCFSGSLLHVGDRLYDCSLLRRYILRPGSVWQQFSQRLPVKRFTRLHCCCQVYCTMVTGSNTFLSALAFRSPTNHSIRSQSLHFQCLGRRFGAGGSTTCCLPCTQISVFLLNLSVQDSFGGDMLWWRYFRHSNLHAVLLPSRSGCLLLTCCCRRAEAAGSGGRAVGPSGGGPLWLGTKPLDSSSCTAIIHWLATRLYSICTQALEHSTGFLACYSNPKPYKIPVVSRRLGKSQGKLLVKASTYGAGALGVEL